MLCLGPPSAPGGLEALRLREKTIGWYSKAANPAPPQVSCGSSKQKVNFPGLIPDPLRGKLLLLSLVLRALRKRKVTGPQAQGQVEM